MDLKFFIVSLKDIIINPVKAWETIDSENKTVRFVRDSYLLPLTLLVSVAAIAGSLMFTNTQQSTIYSLFVGVKCFIQLYFTIYASAFILGEITFPLDLGRNFTSSFLLMVFSLTPFFLCQILSNVFESLLFINVIGLYGLYIFWSGTEKLLNSPRYKKMPMLIAITLITVAIYAAAGILLSGLIDKIYFAFFSK